MTTTTPPSEPPNTVSTGLAPQDPAKNPDSSAAQDWRTSTLRSFMRNLNTLAGLAAQAFLRVRFYSGLSALALVGIIMAVGLVTSAAFFAQAVDQVMMRRELTEYTRITRRPPFSARVFTSSSRSVPLSLERAEILGEHVGDTIAGETRLPIRETVMIVDTGIFELYPSPDDNRYESDRPLDDVNVIYMTDVAGHIEIVDGLLLDEASSGQMLEAWMHSTLAAELGIQVGEILQLASTNALVDIPVRIAGFWQSIDPKEAYWPSDPEQTMQKKLLARRQDYLAYVEPALEVKARTATWQVVLDEEKALPAQARNYKEGFERAATVIPKYLPEARLTTPTLTLEKFVGRQTALTTLLLGFNVPALGFLLYFLVLTSSVIAYWQRRETSLLRSRGISRTSILNFTAIEMSLLFIVGCPLGLAFGVGLAKMMGYAVSFLAFDWRPPLPVSIHGLSMPLTIATLAVVLAAKLWSVGLSAKETVVTQQREHARPSRGPFWYRNYLDLLLIIPTAYAYQQLTQQGWIGALVQDRPEDLYQDPLLILVPGLFIITMALLAMRLFPLLMRALDLLAGWLPWFTSFLALRQLGRQSQNYITPLLLVIVSLALGVYTLSMAASMDQWLEDRLFYRVGSDLAFEPFSETEAMATAETRTPGAEWVPPIDEFEALPGVAAATRIGDYTAEIGLAAGQGSTVSGRFLGIDRVDFPHAAWFRQDFSRESLGALMNRLALVPEGILVPQDFLAENNLRIGDSLSLLVLPDYGVRVKSLFTIVGTYEHFPTVYDDAVTVVGNLEHIFSFFGLSMPHNIWSRLEEGAHGQDVLDAVPTLGIGAIREQDTAQLLAEEQAKMERVGVFGTLSVSFLAAALMAALGLLTYSYASLHERLYQFSVLRAVGVRRSEIIGQVAMEYTLLTAYGAAAGVICGIIAANLFVPLFRVSTAPGAPLPPLLPVIAKGEIIPLAAAFAGIMIALEIIIIWAAFYRRLFEALRLGHHG